MNDIQNILDTTFPFVETLLKEYGEFYPLASIVNVEHKVEQFMLSEDKENDFPKSTSVIEKLKNELRLKKNQFLAIAVFYDVRLKERQTDAIAIFVELKKEKEAYTFYYPYELIGKDLVFSKSWKEKKEIEIFDN